MSLEELQQNVDAWIKTYGVRYFSELTNMAILTEEVGEVAKLVTRMYGEQSFKQELSDEEKKAMLQDEMADVLWVLTCLANQTGINLTEAMNQNFEKKTKRDSERHHNNNKLK
ncbi:MAG: nucleotide pyrophosphohydrolase [Saprospiraceae bacterium]|nr:nucleotide pyrophosphohydrolase [Saprospiraceae bacterium]